MSHTGQKKNRVLVTGGSGQIGSRLVPALVERGHGVVVVDQVLPDRYQLRTGGDVSSVDRFACDLSDTETIKKLAPEAFAGVSQLIHLAAMVTNTPSTSPEAVVHFDEELRSILGLLQVLPDLESFCFTSSIMVYGSADDELISEDHPTEPNNTYGLLKLASEKILGVHARRTGCKVAILRLSSVYGTTVVGTRAIPSFVRAVLGGHTPIITGDDSVKRDYVYVDDAVSGIILAVEARQSGIFNIGSGKGTTVAQLSREVARAAGIDVLPKHEPSNRAIASANSLVCDIARAKECLGFAPRYDLASGLKKLIESEHSRALG